MATVFDEKIGTQQGRVIPERWTPTEGRYLFVLGRDLPGWEAELAPGDFTEISQSATFGTAKVLRCDARVRGPLHALEGNLAWRAELRINDAVVTSRDLLPGQTRTLTELAWPVASLGGETAKVSFRLVLLGTTAPTADVEIPAFYVDGIFLDPTYARPIAINRSPEPTETGVAATTTISIDLVDLGPDGISTADTEIYVDDVLAFDGGAFQPGFDGPASASSAPAAGVLRVTIDPTSSLAAGSHAVRAVTKVVGGALTDILYAFLVGGADILVPEVATAAALRPRLVRVTFTEPMSSALSPGSYVFTREAGALAAPVVATSVVAASSTEYDVTLDQAMTPGASYTVTVVGPTDVAGNPVAAPNNDATFAGYAPAIPSGREWSLLEMLPEMNRAEDNGDLEKLIAIFQEIGDMLLAEIDRFTDCIDPDLAEEAFVDAMLQDLGNPFPFPLALIDRRRLVRTLVSIYKQKGTAPGMIGAVRFFLGIEVTISTESRAPLGLGDWELGEDWILGSSELSDLLTFIVTSPRAFTDDERRRVREIIEYMRYAQEHFKIVEPAAPPEEIDHLELGESELGVNWELHGTTSAPSIVSLNYDLGDPLGGGNSIVITGTNLAGASVDIGGTAQTVTANDDTSVTFTLSAKPAGAYTLTVTTAGGNATTSFEFWFPGVEASCTLCCEKPNYDATGDGLWTARVGTNLVSGGVNTPAASAGAPNFSGGGAEGLRTAAISGIVKTSGTQEGSILVVSNPDTAGVADATTPYTERGLLGQESQGAVGFGHSTDGARAFITDGTYKQVARPLATGGVHTAMMRFLSGADLNVNVDGTWATPVAIGTVGLTGTTLFQFGCNYNNSAVFDGIMFAVATFNEKISDAVATKAHKWSKQRHSSA